MFLFCFFQFMWIMSEENIEFNVDELKSVMAIMQNKKMQEAIQSLLKVSEVNTTEEKITPGMYYLLIPEV